MIKTSKQLKDLVGNRAHGDSAKSMLFLRNYAMERFLERLSASKYRNCFILKGGMLISAMVGIDSRATMDKTRIPLKIDISTGDVITPCEISFSYQLMFENRTIPLLAYPP